VMSLFRMFMLQQRIKLILLFVIYKWGFELVNRFIDNLYVVTTNNYNTIADILHTKSSESAFTSPYCVTCLTMAIPL
jgi:hypothetical protein